jgi:nitronate monooxygenase
VPNLRHVRDAIEAKADIVVAQGSEAGGRGATRGTFTLVPEVADVLVRESPDTMLLATGGVADGRGLAAALALGADGVLVGTRLCAAEESLVRPLHRAALVDAAGDSTVRTHVPDIVRSLPWPKEFTARVQRNRFVERWHGHESELAQQAAVEAPATCRPSQTVIQMTPLCGSAERQASSAPSVRSRASSTKW